MKYKRGKETVLKKKKLVFGQIFFRTKKTENVGNDVGIHGRRRRLSDRLERHLAVDDHQPGLEDSLHGCDTSKSKKRHLHFRRISNFVLSVSRLCYIYQLFRTDESYFDSKYERDDFVKLGFIFSIFRQSIYCCFLVS